MEFDLLLCPNRGLRKIQPKLKGSNHFNGMTKAMAAHLWNVRFKVHPIAVGIL